MLLLSLFKILQSQLLLSLLQDMHRGAPLPHDQKKVSVERGSDLHWLIKYINFAKQVKDPDIGALLASQWICFY